MFEIQLEKLNKAKKEQTAILEEIVDFLNNQMEELRQNGIDFVYDYDHCDVSFGLDNDGSLSVNLRY